MTGQRPEFLRRDLTVIEVLRLVHATVTDEIAEPWDEGSEWMAKRVRAVLLGEPEPVHPSNRWVQEGAGS